LVEVVTAYIEECTADGYPEDWDLLTLEAALTGLYPLAGDLHSLPMPLTRESLLHAVTEDAQDALARYEAEIEERDGPGATFILERDVLLDSIDVMWRNHLYEMDYLATGIGLRALANRNPFIEYQSEGFDMFVQMLEGAKELCIRSLFQPTA